MNAHATEHAPAAVGLPPGFEHARHLAWRVAIIGGLVSLLPLVFSTTRFAQSYLVAFLFWFGISAASLGAVLLSHLVGGLWGFLIRRPAEAAARNFPLLVLLFIPIALTLGYLYPWANSDYMEHHHHVQQKAAYLNKTFWLGRMAFYFLLWSGLTAFLVRLADAQDRTTDPKPTRTRQFFSGPGLGLFFLTFTFAAMDLGMSLEPDWYSTIYGVMVLVGSVLATLSFMVILTSKLADREPLKEVATKTGFHDLGNMMLGFTMLWAYMSFSQYLITYSGNLTEEIIWYLHRSVGIWRVIAVCLIVFHFFVPFFLLLSRDRKRNAQALAKVGLAILVMRFVDLTWLVVPSQAVTSTVEWIMLLIALPATMAAVGGVWLGSFLGKLEARPLLPSRNDPLLLATLEHHEHKNKHTGGGH
ncbi:hypothetical protein [Singulisphaera sp. PoT]|uniref:hypothetical protein n=1 Tax=Singulisphaera sp. PoT TaxID=3411797 RepID=UPI003BF55AC3